MEQRSRLILASQSPMRLALLGRAGLVVEARPAHVDETAIKAAARAAGATPATTSLRLAEAKAARIAPHEPDALVIAADQLLVCDGVWHDKPNTSAGARAQLVALRGRTHRQVTASVCQRGGTVLWRHVAEPSLTMRSFSDDFLDAYLAAEGEAITGIVGSYRLEGPGAQLFDRIEGDHFAVLGLPLLPLLGFLRESGAIGG